MRVNFKRSLRKLHKMGKVANVSKFWKLTKKCLVYAVCIFFTAIFTIASIPESSLNSGRTENFPSDLKYILFWKPNSSSTKNFAKLHAKRAELFETGQTIFIKQKCSYINCYISYDPSLLKNEWNYDAIVFDVQDLKKYSNVKNINFARAPYQKYIFRSMHSAENHYLCHKNIDNFFNLTWTYKLNSDIPHPFFNILSENNTIVGPQINITWIEPMKNNVKRFEGKVKHKTKAVAWFRDCGKGADSQDDFYEEFKRELESYNYTLETYGSCGDKTCPDGETYKCYNIIEKEYFFLVVPENSIAEDYVTETLMKVLQHTIIPIVLGGADYRRFIPPGAYINVKAFDIKKLGAIIDYLIKNKLSHYIHFFDWKNHYSYNLRPQNYVCDLCAKLNEISDKSQINNDFRKWWNPKYEDICLRKKLYNKFAKKKVHDSISVSRSI